MWKGGVRVIVLDEENRMLLVRQRHGEKDIWMVPGGGIEEGESAVEAAVREEVAVKEPSVIIAQRPCALLKYVKYSGHCRVNPDACRDCRVCMKLGCPALTIREGRVTVDTTQCNGCGLCVNVCPFHAIEKEAEQA